MMTYNGSNLYFRVLYGIKRNGDGDEYSDGILYESLDEAAKNQRRKFESEIEEIRLHSYRDRIRETAICYIQPVTIDEDGIEDHIDLPFDGEFEELARRVDDSFMSMNGEDITRPYTQYMGDDDED